MASKTGEDMVIDAKKLCLTFDANDGPVHALKDVDLGIEKGDFVSFIGPSGCGKTTLRNVGLPLEIMGLSAAEKAERVARTLDLVGLDGFGRKFPWQLSGGMQQRASIARALAFDADLLLMDEPFGALDEIVRDHLNEQLLELWRKTGKTICFVTHSIPEAVYLSNKIVVMSPRPGRVTDIIESDLPTDRPLDIRESKKFLDIAQRVRNGLRDGHSYE